MILTERGSLALDWLPLDGRWTAEPSPEDEALVAGLLQLTDFGLAQSWRGGGHRSQPYRFASPGGLGQGGIWWWSLTEAGRQEKRRRLDAMAKAAP